MEKGDVVPPSRRAASGLKREGTLARAPTRQTRGHRAQRRERQEAGPGGGRGTAGSGAGGSHCQGAQGVVLYGRNGNLWNWAVGTATGPDAPQALHTKKGENHTVRCTCFTGAEPRRELGELGDLEPSGHAGGAPACHLLGRQQVRQEGRAGLGTGGVDRQGAEGLGQHTQRT